jgi:hypothetical protein
MSSKPTPEPEDDRELLAEAWREAQTMPTPTREESVQAIVRILQSDGGASLLSFLGRALDELAREKPSPATGERRLALKLHALTLGLGRDHFTIERTTAWRSFYVKGAPEPLGSKTIQYWQGRGWLDVEDVHEGRRFQLTDEGREAVTTAYAKKAMESEAQQLGARQVQVTFFELQVEAMQRLQEGLGPDGDPERAERLARLRSEATERRKECGRRLRRLSTRLEAIDDES